jgi:hypothetical protein
MGGEPEAGGVTKDTTGLWTEARLDERIGFVRDDQEGVPGAQVDPSTVPAIFRDSLDALQRWAGLSAGLNRGLDEAPHDDRVPCEGCQAVGNPEGEMRKRAMPGDMAHIIGFQTARLCGDCVRRLNIIGVQNTGDRCWFVQDTPMPPELAKAPRDA